MSIERPICAVGALVQADDRFLLVKRGREPQVGLWAVPGGKVGWGETMKEAVVREVAEETGLVVEVGDPVWIGESIGPGDPASWHFCLIDFAARQTGGELQCADDADEAGWFTREEALELPLTETMRQLFETLT
jgi:ADP-ribose pyrophosphatase YjhB (NUDIX family)